MTHIWIGLTALAFGIMAGSLSLLCVFALEVEGGRKEPAPERGASEAAYADAEAEWAIPQPCAMAHAEERDRLTA